MAKGGDSNGNRADKAANPTGKDAGGAPAAAADGLLDVIAPTQKAATAVLANFKQVVKDKLIRIHPVVTQLVDPAVLEKMKVKGEGKEV